MVSFLFIRTFLFITILTTCCKASISIEVVEGKTDKVVIENKDGSNNTHFCVSNSERAVIVDQKLKCVSQSEIISTVKATDKIRDTDNCTLIRFDEKDSHDQVGYMYTQGPTPLYILNYDERNATFHNATCIILESNLTIPNVLSITKNTCGELDPGVLYFINFTAFDSINQIDKTICQIFTVSGVIADSDVTFGQTNVSTTDSAKVTITEKVTTTNTLTTTSYETTKTTKPTIASNTPIITPTNSTTAIPITSTALNRPKITTIPVTTDAKTTAGTKFTGTKVTSNTPIITPTNSTILRGSIAITSTALNRSKTTTIPVTNDTTTTTITKPTDTTLTNRMKNTTATPALPPQASKSSDYLLYGIIAGCVVLVLIIVGLLYWLCRRRKKDSKKDVELDMEELYAKPIKKKRKYQAKTTTNEYEMNLLPGYVQIGTIIAGTYERRDSYGSDSELINNPVDRTNSVKLDFLNSAGIQDNPYEIIGRASLFKAGLKRESNTSTLQLRSDMENNVTEGSQESIDKTDSAVTLKPDDKNGGVKRLSSFKPESSIRQQRTSICRGKLDNPVSENVKSTPPVSRDGSPLPTVRIEKENVDSTDQNQKIDKTKRNSKSNSYENVTGINVNTSNGLKNNKDKSHSYEEIWNEDPTKTGILENLDISNSQGNCLDSPYQSIPNTNNEIGKSEDNLQTSFLETENKLNNLESSKNENDTDSGYEEIWSHQKNSVDNNIEADDTQKQVKSPHYTEIETISSGKTFKKAEDSHYVDVYLK